MSLLALRDPMNEVILRLRMEGSSIKSEQELEDFLRSVSALSPGGGGTLIFSSYVGSSLASTIYPK